LSPRQDGIRRLTVSVCAVMKVILMEVFESIAELLQL
jgi:hypothetical protein